GAKSPSTTPMAARMSCGSHCDGPPEDTADGRPRHRFAIAPVHAGGVQGLGTDRGGLERVAGGHREAS
ncbi:MAG TPA: hypothetical protein VN327_11405, partial [Pseudonocardiaceae bacterium]|nr:hypothetical protein [Pseudonocardiaceae bacterium]